MKRNSLRVDLLNGILTLVIVLGGVGCMITGLELPGVNVFAVIIWTVLCTAGCLVGCRLKKMWLVLGALGITGLFVWRFSGLSKAVEGLVYRVSSYYHETYGWKVISWGGIDPMEVDVTQAVCLVTTIISLCLTLVLAKGLPAWLGITVGVLPLVSCMLLIDTVPGAWPLFCLLFGVLLLLLTQRIRKKDAERACVMTVRLSLPLVFALALVFLLNPKATYHGQIGAEKLEEAVVDLFGDAGNSHWWDKIDLGLSGFIKTSEKENLRGLTPTPPGEEAVMEIIAPQTGAFYLRGNSYNVYDGNSWKATNQKEKEGSWGEVSDFVPAGKVSIVTKGKHDVLYMPYYSAEENLDDRLKNGKIENRKGLKSYEVEQFLLPKEYTADKKEYDNTADNYRKLPRDVEDWAEKLVENILGESVPLRTEDITREKVETIVSYVKNSAVYDLNTPQMPADAEDFAQWFLTESETGYCVHFATAATVLLQAAGIPARYVSGYSVSVMGDYPVEVHENDAHAWVEYRLPGEMWRAIDATPGFSPSGTAMPVPESSETEFSQPEESSQPESSELSETSSPESSSVITDADADGDGTQGRAPIRLTWLWRIAEILLGIAMAAVLLILQWRLRLSFRRKKMSVGRTNARALACWREVRKLSRLLKEKPEQELYELALKAKYSQHRISAEELLTFRKSIKAKQARLQEKPFALQLIYRLLFAIY